ncbi:MAG: peptidase C39 family protein, partial [Thermoplasmata archaeon]
MPPRVPPFWSQRTPFTCGPAALANVLLTLGWAPTAPSRDVEEARIWRDSSALACPGSHPWGLALASGLRGHPARVGIEGTLPFLFEHIRSDHPGVSRQFYSGVANDLRTRARALGARSARDPVSEGTGPGSAGLLLVEAGPL